ncbi:DUF3263 domain-containing protein [Amnibacterium flavum]|nr:DUF3263 domain-containing protein [Amnibacterium flavum]
MLPPEELSLLTFQDTHPQHRGAKEAAIRTRFGIGSARFYQRVHSLVRRPDVVAEYPQLAFRILRLEESAEHRREERSRMRRVA